eukprot:COSAG06_NODE_1869_length_8172_cov_3.579143_14_plen_193_part_00
MICGNVSVIMLSSSESVTIIKSATSSHLNLLTVRACDIITCADPGSHPWYVYYSNRRFMNAKRLVDFSETSYRQHSNYATQQPKCQQQTFTPSCVADDDDAIETYRFCGGRRWPGLFGRLHARLGSSQRFDSADDLSGRSGPKAVTVQHSNSDSLSSARNFVHCLGTSDRQALEREAAGVAARCTRHCTMTQ